MGTSCKLALAEDIEHPDGVDGIAYQVMTNQVTGGKDNLLSRLGLNGGSSIKNIDATTNYYVSGLPVGEGTLLDRRRGHNVNNNINNFITILNDRCSKNSSKCCEIKLKKKE